MSDNEGMLEEQSGNSKNELGRSNRRLGNTTGKEEYSGGPISVTLSKYDQDKLKKGLERRKDDFNKEGGVLGRVLNGPAFESTPRVIEFKDFTLGEPHLKTITLTNVTDGSNYFKIQPIEDEFRVAGPLTTGLFRDLLCPTWKDDCWQ